jgi:hypothetical protein
VRLQSARKSAVQAPRTQHIRLVNVPFLVIAIAALLFSSSATATTNNNIYLAQASTGAANGADCADALPYTYFNNSANWTSGTPTGLQIGPGTTVHLCGGFSFAAGTSGALTVQGSGTSSSPIRVQFENGATASAPYWGSGGFITMSGRGFIQIDGSPTSTPCGYVNSRDVACNGVIQATANGASLANHVGNGHAIDLAVGDHDIEVRNISCQNLFVPVQNSSNNETTAGVNNSACVWWLGGSGGGNINVHNNVINNSFNGVLLAYEGSNSGMHADNNWMTGIEVGVQEGAGGGGASISSGSINQNDFSNMANWDAPGDANHHEFIHLYTQQSGATISNFTISGNYFHGTLGATMTSEIYVECDGGSSCSAPGGINVLEFNNVVVNEDSNADISSGAGGNTMTECEGATCQIYNNTYYSSSHFSTLNCAIHLEAGSVITVKNNIFSGMSCAIANGSGTVNASSNLGYGLATACGSPCAASGNPDLNMASSPEFQLMNNASAAYDTGTNLTLLGIAALNTDQLGVGRPAVGNWDLGAFQYGTSSGTQPNPPANLQATLQ